MKKVLLMAICVMATISGVSAATTTDTVPAINSKITKWIEDESVNTQGKKTVKYYVVYEGTLISTTKSVVEKTKVAQKHQVAMSYFLVRKNKKNTKLID